MAKYDPTKEVVQVDDDSARRTGRSTRQLRRLPRGSWFFTDNVEYHKHLASSNGRWDIQMKHISVLDSPASKLRGIRVIACDVDLYAQGLLTDDQWRNYNRLHDSVALP